MTSTPHQTPAALGYRFPAEWERHAGTWLSWPHRLKTWPGNFEPIPGVWAALARTLAEVEEVHILASGAALESARTFVGSLQNVTLHDAPTNDAWCRDHGPMFLVDGPADAPIAIVDWGFNAYGGKYPACAEDNDVPRRVAELLKLPRFEPGIILEGGSIDGNGLGTLLTTEQCLLNPNRNPQLARSDIERYLADYCGMRKTIWLGGGIVGDDTDGHIDELARFVGPRTVVVAVEEDPSDVNYAALQDNLARLQHAADQDGRPLEIVPLPMPRAVVQNGLRLPASYCNFYIANRLVIVPQFGDPADAQAVEILAKFFPDRRVQGLRAVELVLGLGAFHCITQQQPA
jgi:agmatine deiminase